MPTYYQNQTDDFDFDLSGVSAESNFDCVPPGEYQMQAISVEIQFSRAGNRLVKAHYQILGGEFNNRRVFESFNLENSNPQTVEIALKQIKQWGMACGLTGNERLTMGLLKSLEGKEFVGKVYIEPDKTGQYEDKNRIRRFMPLPVAAPITAPQPSIAPPIQPPKTVTAPPKPLPPAATAQPPKRPWESKR